MNEQEKREVQAIAVGQVERSLQRMIDTYDGQIADNSAAAAVRSEAARLRAEAERLSASSQADLTNKPDVESDGASRFAGVKYVVGACGRTWRVISEAVYLQERFTSDYAGVANPVFLMLPDGETGWDAPCHLTPWHPPVGEKVRDEKDPEQVGTVTELWSKRCPCRYVVDWERRHWRGETLSDLRPYSFPPEPQPEDEKPQFEAGELVAIGETSRVFMAARGGGFTDISGRVMCALDASGLQLATDAQVWNCLRHQPMGPDEQAATVGALRAQAKREAILAKHIAKAARPAGAERTAGEAGE